LKWAIAGTNVRRLEKLRGQLLKGVTRDIGETRAEPVVIEVIQVNKSQRPEDFEEMCERAKVIVSTDLGPSSKSGIPLIRACLEKGCDYLNSSPEALWSYKVISEFHEEAMEKNVRIVLACGGFTALADLAVFQLSQQIPRGVKPFYDHYIGPTKASFNARSLAALLYMWEPNFQIDPKLVYKCFRDTRLLNFSSKRTPNKHKDISYPSYSRLLSRWTCPFLMAPLSTRQVHRSDEFNEYGDRFQFNEYIVLESVFTMILYLFFYGFYIGALSFPPTRYFIKKFIVDTKKVPSKNSLSHGSYASCVVVKDSTAVNRFYTCSVSLNKGDVMFKGTAAILSEAGYCLGFNEAESGGVYTPSSCPGLGQSLIDKLNETTNIEFDFEIGEGLTRSQVSERVLSAG